MKLLQIPAGNLAVGHVLAKKSKDGSIQGISVSLVTHQGSTVRWVAGTFSGEAQEKDSVLIVDTGFH